MPSTTEPPSPRSASTTKNTTPTQTGIVISTATATTAGGWSLNHAEGIVVSTAITAGGPGLVLQDAEGIVVSTPIAAGGELRAPAGAVDDPDGPGPPPG